MHRCKDALAGTVEIEGPDGQWHECSNEQVSIPGHTGKCCQRAPALLAKACREINRCAGPRYWMPGAARSRPASSCGCAPGSISCPRVGLVCGGRFNPEKTTLRPEGPSRLPLRLLTTKVVEKTCRNL